MTSPQALGCVVSFWKPDEEIGWRFSVDDLERQLARRNPVQLDTLFAEHSDCLCWNRPEGGSIGFPRVECSEREHRPVLR